MGDSEADPLIQEIASFRQDSITLIEEIIRDRHPENATFGQFLGLMKKLDLDKSPQIYLAKYVIDIASTFFPTLGLSEVERNEELGLASSEEVKQFIEKGFDKTPILQESDRQLVKQQLAKAKELADRFNPIFANPLLSDYHRDVLKEVGIRETEAPVSILYFWASWCGPCKVTLPELVELRNQFSLGQLTIVTVNLDSDNQEEMIDKFNEKFSLNYPVFPDNYSKKQELLILALPYSVIFKNGEVIESHLGLSSTRTYSAKRINAIINGTDALLHD